VGAGPIHGFEQRSINTLLIPFSLELGLWATGTGPLVGRHLR